jgi:hypothetical protein
MIIIGILLNIVGLGTFCWLLFTPAIYAVPFSWYYCGDLFASSRHRSIRRPCRWPHCGWFHTRDRAVRLRRRSRSRCPPRHWADICSSCGTRWLRCDLQPRPPRCSLEMVAGSVRRVWRHHRRWHRLGAHVDPDRARSERGCCTGPSSPADWGDGQGQVTQWVCRLSVGISAEIRSSSMTATSRSSRTRLNRSKSSAACEPVATGKPAGFCLLVDKGAPFCTPGLLFLRWEPGASCVGRSIADTSP